LRLLEDPALDARDAHPAWLPGHDAVVQLYPDADPPPDATAFAFWRIPATSNCCTTARAGADRAQPGHCLRLRWRPAWRTAWPWPMPIAAAAPRMCPTRLRQWPAQATACGAAGAAHLAGARRDPGGRVLARRGRRLFGADAAAGWYSDGGLRSKVRRLVRRGDALMRGGYRRLAQLPPLEKGRFEGRKTTLSRASFSETASIRLRCVAGALQPMEVLTMRPAPLRPAATVSTAAAQPQRYLTNDEAADYLRLSPRTLEKQRVIGGGPSSASSAAASCTPWPTSMPGPPTAASRARPIPNTPSTTRRTAVRADRWRAGGLRHVQPALPRQAGRSANSSTCSAPCRATWRRATART
jgi:hypothetical protein